MTDWVDGIRQRFSGFASARPPRWAVIPGVVACFALLGTGAWVGVMLGSAPGAVSDTFQIVRSGKVVTVHGVKKVLLPARTITRKGRTIRLPASEVTLTQDRFSALPAQTVVRSGRTVTLPASTVTQIDTVTQTGPTQTVTEVTTVTETGPTVTVTVTT